MHEEGDCAWSRKINSQKSSCTYVGRHIKSYGIGREVQNSHQDSCKGILQSSLESIKPVGCEEQNGKKSGDTCSDNHDNTSHHVTVKVPVQVSGVNFGITA